MFLVCFWVYPSYTEIQPIWSCIDIEINCLKELLVTWKMIRTHRVQDIVSIWYVAARKLCLVVDSHVKKRSCTLSYKNCHVTLLCLQHHFGTILTIFAKFKYYFDKLAINTSTFQKWRIMSLSHPHCKVSRTSASLVWEISKQLKVFSFFSYQNLSCFFSIW